MVQRSNNEISTAWRALSALTATEGWRSIPITGEGSLKFRAGCRFPGKEEALLIAFDSVVVPNVNSLPEGHGFRLEKVSIDGSEKWIALVRQNQGGLDFFSFMIEDIFLLLSNDLNNQYQLYQVFLGRIRAWQEFMKNGQNGLSPEAELGLVGELLCLETLLDEGLPVHLVVESWKGPFDGIQDFEIGNGAIEVKSTLSIDSFSASILSLEQLDDSTRHPLFIYGCRFIFGLDGLSLSQRVLALRNRISSDRVALSIFNNGLLHVGYFDMHSDLYTRKFTLSNCYIILVDNSFPRLTLGNVPSGVRRARYEIDLSSVMKNHISLNKAIKLIGVI